MDDTSTSTSTSTSTRTRPTPAADAAEPSRIRDAALRWRSSSDATAPLPSMEYVGDRMATQCLADWRPA